MSLSISTRYGSRANDPTLDYPTGSFKNKTAPDALDGTPLEKDWANDLLGARDAILAAAGLTANGTADTAQASQLLAALQALGLRAATETQAGVLEIATAAEAQALVNDTNALTPAKLASVTATETRAGLIEIATTAEAQALINDANALTPKKLADAFSGAKYQEGSSGGTFLWRRVALPNGFTILAISWIITIGSGGAAQLNFPIAFPNDCSSLIATGWGSPIGHSLRSKTGATVSNVGTNTSLGMDLIAMGY